MCGSMALRAPEGLGLGFWVCGLGQIDVRLHCAEVAKVANGFG
jgi:hypothetical protein